jgi:hypothetical protein
MVNIAVGARRLHLYLAANDTSVSYQAGRVAGRLFFLALIPVFAIALIYWLSGRSRPEPTRFSHAISRWWVWVVGLLTGFLLLVVLGFALAASAAQRQAALEASASPVPEPTVPNGWTLQRDSADGFELVVPSTWVYARTDSRFDNDLAPITAAHPDAADVLRRIKESAASKGLKFAALDPSQPSGYYTSILIVVYDAGVGPSLDAAASDYAGGIEESSQVAKPVAKQRVSLPAGAAVRVEDRATGTIAFSQISYVLLHPKNGRSLGVVLVMSSATDQIPTTKPMIEQVANSFRLID